MRIAIYCRVSTEGQEQDGTSLKTQLEACQNYCQDKSYEVVHEFSEAWSGLSLERPRLSELREVVRSESIDCVVVYSLDRFSRDPVHGVILMQELEKHSVSLEAVSETLDNSEVGKLISYIRGYASKLEAEKIRERTMRGKKAHLANGKLPQGTGKGIYGYNWNKETKKRDIHQFEAAIVRDIFQRASAGESLISIARTLNQRSIPTKGKKIWHSLTIRRMIKNTSYIGQTYFKDVLLPDVTPAIVDIGIFQAANAQLDRTKTRTGFPKNEYLLRNHAYCAICGKPLVGHCLNKRYRYYQCSDARPYENSKKKCNARYIRADDIEEIVWNKTKAVLQDPGIIIKQMTEHSNIEHVEKIEADIKELEKQLHNYDKRRTNLIQAIEWNEFSKDEILDRINEIKRLQIEDKAKLNDLLKTRDNLASLANAKIKFSDLYSRVLQNLENADLDLKRLALDALDIKVYASKASTEIKGVIPLELALPTIEQTSASLFHCRYSYTKSIGYSLARV